MTTLTYSVSRKQAADALGVSTRTVDRYVKKGKLSYKKVSNNVLLAEEEIDDMAQEFELLHKEPSASSVVKEKQQNNKKSSGIPMQKLATKTKDGDYKGVKEFVDLLENKDKTIEEKNQMISALQYKLGELESKLEQMVALPDHTQEKEKLVHSIQQLELERQQLSTEIRKEKTWNAVYIGLILVAAATIMFFALGM